MPDFLFLAVQYGGYVSAVKLAVFVGLFFGWLWLVGWIHQDAKAAATNVPAWTGGVLGAAAVAILVWLLVPIFVVGLSFFLLAVGGTALAYVKHRNGRVMDYDRVLTVEHIKSLFVKSEKLEAMADFLFITANNNEVPPPEPKTPEFFGYRTAYEMVEDAAWRRASTIVMTPTAESYEVTYHVDGAPLKQPAMAKEQSEYLIHFVKQLADLDIKEKRKPQRGKFRTRQNKENTDWEVATAGSTAGEQIQLRRLSKESAFRVVDLGLAPDQVEQMSRFHETPQGLFLVSGPRKSGVTTTMYALLRNHDAYMNNVNTIERQPTAELPNVTQNTYKPSDTGTTTYAERLRTLIRMGPDVVGVGECEDSETAKVASAGAADGKIVYVVLEAGSLIHALGKWVKLVGDKRLVSETLLGISCQRLLRKLCEQCKQGYAPNTELLKKFNLPAEKAKVLYRPGKEVYDKRGKPSMCEACQGTGFVGRIGVFETIAINEDLRTVIRHMKSLPEVGAEFRRAKMLYLQEQALRKVIAGTTAINEMLRVLTPAKQGQAAPPSEQ